MKITGSIHNVDTNVIYNKSNKNMDILFKINYRLGECPMIDFKIGE